MKRRRSTFLWLAIVILLYWVTTGNCTAHFVSPLSLVNFLSHNYSSLPSKFPVPRGYIYITFALEAFCNLLDTQGKDSCWHTGMPKNASDWIMHLLRGACQSSENSLCWFYSSTSTVARFPKLFQESLILHVKCDAECLSRFRATYSMSL